MSDVSDPVVARALRRLEPPAPSPRFWEELVERLRDEHATRGEGRGGRAPGGAGPHAVPARAGAAVTLEGPTGGRRRVRVPAAVLAAAAAVAALLLVGRPDGGLEVRTKPPASPPPSSKAPGGPATASERAEQAARRWVATAARGDARAGWAMLGPQSRESFADDAAFAATMGAALRDGWGRWASAPQVSFAAAPLGQLAGERLVVVTVTGLLTGEGSRRPAAAALVVRVGAGAEAVEPFVPGPAVGLVTLPATGAEPTIPPEGPVDIAIDADAHAFAVVVDGQAQALATLERGAGGAIRRWRPAAPLAPGRHVITVAYVTASGTIASHAAVFRAE